MKVVWAHNFDPAAANAGVFMYTLARGLGELGVDPQLEYLGNLRRLGGIWRAAKRLRAISRDFDLVHAQFGSACGFATSMAPQKKIVSLRGSDWHRLKAASSIRARAHAAAATMMTRASLKRFDAIVVMSERMKREVAEARPESRTFVIPDGVDLEEFYPMPRDTARARLGAHDDSRPWVVFPTVESNNPVKRRPLAEAAVSIARRTHPEIQLKIATGVPHSSMPFLMNAASVVLMTSVHEGWPNSIKEALACNTPFVSTDVSDLAAIAGNEPSCGVTSPEPEALAAALIRAIDAPRSSTLRSRVEWLDSRRVAARLLDVYVEVCG